MDMRDRCARSRQAASFSVLKHVAQVRNLALRWWIIRMYGNIQVGRFTRLMEECQRFQERQTVDVAEILPQPPPNNVRRSTNARSLLPVAVMEPRTSNVTF